MKTVSAIIIVNLLTTVRIIGVFCLLPIYLEYGGVAAASLSVACYFTDLIDGVIARKYHASTFFGSTFDGVADKAFSVANLIVLFTMTKFAIVPIIFEIAIIIIQTIKYHRNENIQSSRCGKLKTWVMSLTVIVLYLLVDIKSVTILPDTFVNYIASLNQVTLLGVAFIPLYIFEVLTVISYLFFIKGDKHNNEVEIPKVDIKLKPATSVKNRFDNFVLMWLNPTFYERYKDCAGLKQIHLSIKKNR